MVDFLLIVAAAFFFGGPAVGAFVLVAIVVSIAAR
jgi:hypothetical protein